MPTLLRPTLIGALIGALIAILSCTATVASQPALDLSNYRGKVVVVDFWASWCKPCRSSIPWLNQMRSRYGSQGLVIIGVNVDAERDDAERFLRKVPIDFEVLYDSQGVLAEHFKVQGMPSSFVFDRDGKLVSTHLGFRENRRTEHEAEIQTLLSRRTS